MKNRVITISREFGSGGRTIGKAVAEQLGIPCYDNEILQEIASSCQNIEAACGVRPVLLRPPSGSYNDAVIQCIHRAGCIPIQWNLDTLDWQGLSAEEALTYEARRFVEKFEELENIAPAPLSQLSSHEQARLWQETGSTVCKTDQQTEA